LAAPQYRSGTTDFFLPGKFGERFIIPEEASLIHTFRCPGLQDLTVNIMWTALYTRQLTKPFHDMQSYYNANCIKTYDGLGGDEDDQHQRLEKEQDPIQRNITILKTAVRELLFHPDNTTSVPVGTSPAADKHTEEAPSSSQVPVDPKLPQQDEPPKDVDELLDALDILSSQQLPVVKFYDDYGGRSGEMDRATAIQFTELYKGPHDISARKFYGGKDRVL